VRRGLLVAAALSVVAGSSSVTAAPSTQTISLTGAPNTSVLVTTTSPLTVTRSPWDQLGGPAPGALGKGYVGYAITRAGSAEVLVGALRSGGVETAMGFGPLPYAVHFGSALGRALPPGLYRVILLGSQRVQFRTEQRHAALTWRTSTPERVLYESGHPTPVAAELPVLLSHRAPLTVGPRSYVLLGMASSNSLNVVSAQNFCLNSPGAPTCLGGYPEQDVGTAQQPVVLPRTGSSGVNTGGGGGAGFTWFQPGEVPRGPYDALFLSTGQASGPNPWYLLFALP
jgi:hypothetical protein